MNWYMSIWSSIIAARSLERSLIQLESSQITLERSFIQLKGSPVQLERSLLL